MNTKIKELKLRLNNNNNNKKEVKRNKMAGCIVSHILYSTIGRIYNVKIIKQEDEFIYIDVNEYILIITFTDKFEIDRDITSICWELDWIMDNDLYYLGKGYMVVDLNKCVVIDSCKMD